MNDTIVLIGRGDSALRYPHPGPYPRMAVSSGIFKIPKEHPPEHFLTMDCVKFFQAGLWPDLDITWSADEMATAWPFWADETIQKHTLAGRCHPGSFRGFPNNVWQVIPPKHRDAFHESLGRSVHMFGFQPAWGDYSNVRGWRLDRTYPPEFRNPDGVLGLDSLNNSLLFAVQAAHLLGYRHILFSGVDLLEDRFKTCLEHMKRWHDEHLPDDYTWSTLAPESALAEFVPVVELEVEVAA